MLAFVIAPGGLGAIAAPPPAPTIVPAATTAPAWDDRPGVGYQPESTAAAPCGIGTPPRGHVSREVAPAASPDGLTLIVRQDPNRLCYVADGVADAPVIRIRQGQSLTVTLKNEITDPSAIDAYVPSGTLQTPNPIIPETAGFYPVMPGTNHAATGMTNLHVHGFAVPPVAPQDEVLDTCVDPAVGPMRCGHRQVTYHYQIPPNMPAGLYWYHPHVHGEVQAQLLMGLSGAIVVEGPEDDARRAAGIRDRVLIVRQTQEIEVRTPPLGTLPASLTPPPGMAVPAVPKPARVRPRNELPGETIDTEDELLCLSRPEMDRISLNGSKVLDDPQSDTDLARYQLTAGSTELWRVLNAATDAFLDVALVAEDGTPVPFSVVARDGAPLTDDAGSPETPVPTTQSQMVPPAGRLEFLVQAPAAGQKVYLVTHAVDTGCAGDEVPERRLALLTSIPSSGNAAPLPALATPKQTSDFFAGLLARKTYHTRVIAFAEYPRPGSGDQTDYYITELKPGAVLRPYQMGGPPAITVKAGTTEEWVVENWTHELHAFHIHQVHFRVLEVNGKPMPGTPLDDVITVPYATAAGFRSKVGPVIPGRVRVKLYFPESLAGDIPFHCHLADHEDNGMMAVLRVLPADGQKSAQKAEVSPKFLLSHPPICRTAARPAG